MNLKGAAFFTFLSAAILTSAGPVNFRADHKGPGSTVTNSDPAPSATGKPGNNTGSAPLGLELLASGNDKFRQTLKGNTTVQDPDFMVIGCADSKINEQELFNADAGEILSQDNLGAMYIGDNDLNSDTAVTYATTEAGVKHIIVMGHYGCSTVGSAMSSDNQGSIPSLGKWIDPIQEVYKSSDREEIKAFRNKSGGNFTERADTQLKGNNGSSGDREAALNALVEENIKANVKRLATKSLLAKVYGNDGGKNGTSSSSSRGPKPTKSGGASHSGPITKRQAIPTIPPPPSKSGKHPSSTKVSHPRPSQSGGPGGKEDVEVWVHGFVLNETSGQISDLGVSFGPPGKQVPNIPFPSIKGNNETLIGPGAGPSSAKPSIIAVTTTVTKEEQPITITKTLSKERPEETVTTTVNEKPVTVTVSADPKSFKSNASSASSKPHVSKVITKTSEIEEETVTVTATVWEDAPEETVTTSVKGKPATITVSAHSKLFHDGSSDGPQKTPEPSSSQSLLSPSDITRSQPEPIASATA